MRSSEKNGDMKKNGDKERIVITFNRRYELPAFGDTSFGKAAQLRNTYKRNRVEEAVGIDVWVRYAVQG